MDVSISVVGGAHAESKIPGTAVLIVDDDVMIRMMLRSALEEEGIEVAEAADGQAAVDYVARQRPALILLDMRLPILDGVEVALQIRSLHESLPIIILSADNQLIEKAQRIGALAYFPKPFDIIALLDTVQYALQVSDQQTGTP